MVRASRAEMSPREMRAVVEAVEDEDSVSVLSVVDMNRRVEEILTRDDLMRLLRVDGDIIWNACLVGKDAATANAANDMALNFIG